MTFKPWQLLLILLLLFTFESYSQPGAWNTKPIPAAFIENKGRFTGMDNQNHEELLFKLPGAGVDLYISSTGLSYTFHKLKNIDRVKQNARSKPGSLHYEVERIDMVLKNARISRGQADVSYGKSTAFFNYYSRDISIEKEKPIESITFREVYPGIDWTLYIKADALGKPVVKYDFILHAGADTRAIQLQYSRNVHLSIKEGALFVKGKLGSFEEGKLLVYERKTKKEIHAQPVLHGRVLSYQFPEPVMQADVVIDPVLFWGTYLTSVTPGIHYNDLVFGDDVTTDAAGNIFVQLSVSKNVDFPTFNPGGGAYYQDVTASPEGGMVLLKFNRQGVLLWSTFFGAGGGLRIAVNPNGDVYATGIASGASLPLKDIGGYYDPATNFSFMARFDNNGRLDWSTNWLQEGWVATQMKSDLNGNIFITGRCPYFLLPPISPGGGAYMATGTYVLRPFIMKLSPSCNLTWSTQIDGYDGYSGSPHMAFDNNDNLVLGCDSIVRFNASLQLTALFGGGFLNDVAADSHGNIYCVGGGMPREGFPYTDPGAGAYIDPTPSSGKSTGFIMKFDASNKRVWATTLFSSSQSFMDRIVADKSCDAVQVLGIMNDVSTDVPTFDNSCSGGFYYPSGSSPILTGPLLLTFKTTGQMLYSSLTDFPYEYYDQGLGFAIDPFGSLIYLFGDLQNFESISAVKNPVNNAFFQPVRNNSIRHPFLK